MARDLIQFRGRRAPRPPKALPGYRCRAIVEVRAGGGWQPLSAYRDVRDHSPDGFEWGYCGSGPAQLALALLCCCFGRETALAWYQAVKVALVASLPLEGWRLDEEQLRQVLALVAGRRRPAARQGGGP